MNILENLKSKLGERVEHNKNISAYFTMKTQTVAEYFFQAETRDELINAIKVAHELNLPMFMLGGGSNIAVLHSQIPGLTLRNLYQDKKILSENDHDVELFVSSGYSTSRLAAETARDGFEGFEFQFGLPESVGGAICMNSKWVARMDYEGTFPKYMGDSLIRATLLDRSGNIKEVDHDYFHFAYDYSILQETKELFLEGVFKLKKNNPVELAKRTKDALAYRHKTQLVGMRTCGCMFQNISEELKNEKGLPTTSAGYLIDQCGLKNTKIGDFVVSEKHANFIVNTGSGNPEDLVSLLALIKSKVKEKFGIELKEEVVLV
jgi:UDP-N-acetylmuramate dehydrogenase